MADMFDDEDGIEQKEEFDRKQGTWRTVRLSSFPFLELQAFLEFTGPFWNYRPFLELLKAFSKRLII